MAQLPLRIPKLSVAVREATITEWLALEGDVVTEGDELYLVETDKVETEVTSPASGVVHWTADVGETYVVGTQIGYIESSD